MEKKDRIKALAANQHSPIRTLASLEAMSDAELDGLEAHVTKKEGEIKAANQTREARVKALVASPHCAIKTEAALTAMSDEELKTLEASVKTATEAAAAAAPTTTTRASEAAPLSEDEWMKRAPGSVRALVDRAQKAEETQKATLVASLGKSQKVYSEADLKAMSVDDLKKLAALAGTDTGEVDFGGQGFPVTAAATDVYTNPPNGYRIALDAGKKKEATTTH